MAWNYNWGNQKASDITSAPAQGLNKWHNANNKSLFGYKKTSDFAEQGYNSAMNRMGQAADQYTGNGGYENSLAQANKGTKATQGAVVSQAAQAAQNAGMNRSMAQATARNTAAANAANVYGNQQTQAATQGNNAVTAQTNIANMDAKKGEMLSKQASNSLPGIINNMAGLSDGNCKDATPLDKYKEVSNKHFNKPNFKSLIWSKKGDE